MNPETEASLRCIVDGVRTAAIILRRNAVDARALADAAGDQAHPLVRECLRAATRFERIALILEDESPPTEPMHEVPEQPVELEPHMLPEQERIPSPRVPHIELDGECDSLSLVFATKERRVAGYTVSLTHSNPPNTDSIADPIGWRRSARVDLDQEDSIPLTPRAARRLAIALLLTADEVEEYRRGK
jgi:hypothetical protein